MTTRLAALFAAALVLMSAGTLQPQTAKAPVPVDISANEMEILDADKKAVFKGAVDATRGTTNLKADMLTVTYAEVKQADGSPRRTQPISTPRATSPSRPRAKPSPATGRSSTRRPTSWWWAAR